MHNTKKQYGNANDLSEPRKRKDLLQNVISLRISAKEKKTLEKFTSKTSKNISEIMREAINLWSSKRRNSCMD